MAHPLTHLRSALVVDDDALQRTISAAALRAIGFAELHEAGDGAQALQIVAQSQRSVDLALCDLDMAGMDGIQMLSRLAREHPGIAVVLLSSQDQALIAAVGTMAAASGLNIIGTMQKPLDRERLRGFVEALDRRMERPLRATQPGAMPLEEIRRGLQEHEFEPFYQPKINLHDGRVWGAEALARWRHPELGILTPARFIARAEEAALIDELTWQMLDQSLASLAGWLKAGLDVSVSANLNVNFFQDDSVADRVLALAQHHQVAPSRVTLELTESMAASDLPGMIAGLSRLRMRGFGLAIDDFGTGYASLQQLSRVPFSELKVDRSFVAGACDQAHLRAILESSIELGQRLGLSTTAEGVETVAELELVRSLGCQIAQGYYFSGALSQDDFSRWVEQWQHAHPDAA